MKKFSEIKKRLLRPFYVRKLGDAIDFLGPFFVASCILIPLATAPMGGANQFRVFAAGFFVMLASYLTQRFFNSGRIDFYNDFSGYESSGPGFRLNKAAGSIVLSLIMGIITALVTSPYLKEKTDYYTESISLLAVFAGMYVFAMGFVGTVSSFYASMRLVSGRGARICFMLLGGGTLINILGGSTIGFIPYACAVMYIICYMYGSNRITLRHMNHVTEGKHLTQETNAINLALFLMLLLSFLALFGLLYVLISGFLTLLELLLYILANSLFADEKPTDRTILNPVETVFNSTEPYSTPEFAYMITYIFITIFAIFFLIWLKNRNRRNVFDIIAILLRRFLKFLLDPILFFLHYDSGNRKEKEDEEAFLNYIDESERIKSDPYIGGEAEGKNTWHNFIFGFNSKKTARDRFRFAYAGYVRVMRRKHMGMKESDTPRRTADFLKSFMQDEESRNHISDISCEFERIEFAVQEPDKKTLQLTSDLVKNVSREMK